MTEACIAAGTTMIMTETETLSSGVIIGTTNRWKNGPSRGAIFLEASSSQDVWSFTG
jgi:hypothetical protein